MKKYKLTDQNLQTRNGFQWQIGVEVQTDGVEKTLCNDSWLHCYSHPLLAVLLNPIHANISNPRLFEVKALGRHLNDRGLKEGCTKMTLIKELKLPEITLNQKVAFGILCSLEVYKEPKYVKWANDWLCGIDRTVAAAAAHAAAAYVAAATAHVAAAHAAAAAYAYAAAAAYAYASFNLIKIVKEAIKIK